MTKEQIQKHGDIIKWFCDNAELGVWCKNGNSDKSNKDWFLNIEPKFLLDSIYVQNDEYAGLRKAQADDKQLLYKNSNVEIPSLELCNKEFMEFKECLESYRIKPEEPKFKVGDWITDGYEIFEHKENCRAIPEVQAKWELWKPQEGEWVMIADFELKDVYAVFKYSCVNHSKRKVAPLEFAQTLKAYHGID